MLNKNTTSVLADGISAQYNLRLKYYGDYLQLVRYDDLLRNISNMTTQIADLSKKSLTQKMFLRAKHSLLSNHVLTEAQLQEYLSIQEQSEFDLVAKFKNHFAHLETLYNSTEALIQKVTPKTGARDSIHRILLDPFNNQKQSFAEHAYIHQRILDQDVPLSLSMNLSIIISKIDADIQLLTQLKEQAQFKSDMLQRMTHETTVPQSRQISRNSSRLSTLSEADELSNGK